MSRFSQLLILTVAAAAKLLVGSALLPIAAAATSDDDAAYTRAITERAERIIAQLGIADDDQATRARDLIAGQYRQLREIHDARDAKIAQSQHGGDRTVAAAWEGVVRKQADMELFQLHRRYVAQLAAQLTPEQVEKVKDGMTYGVVPLTYHRYLELLPQLTDVEKQEILANLIEAREYAMDAGSSDEKHRWFGKYKGRVNNYLSAAGYNMKQAEQDWAARQQAASPKQVQ